MSQIPDLVGTSECLSDVHLQHDFLLEDDLTAERLCRYRLLVLPSCSCLSVEQVQQIERYVLQGGRLLVSGHTSLYSEDGFGGENFQLAAVMGVDYAGRLTTAPLEFQLRGGQQVRCPDKTVQVRLREGAEMLGELRDEKGRVLGPAIVVNQYGRGVCFYSAPRLAAMNFQPEMTIKRKWTYSQNSAALQLFVELVHRAMADGPVLRAIHLPEKVLVSLYCQERDGQKQWIVHLLNATGVRLELGQAVPSRKSLPAFPSLQGDLVFDLRHKGPCQGHIASPDYAGRRPVRVIDAGDGYQRISVAKEDLKAYAIVYLESVQE